MSDDVLRFTDPGWTAHLKEPTMTRQERRVQLHELAKTHDWKVLVLPCLGCPGWEVITDPAQHTMHLGTLQGAVEFALVTSASICARYPVGTFSQPVNGRVPMLPRWP